LVQPRPREGEKSRHDLLRRESNIQSQTVLISLEELEDTQLGVEILDCQAR